MPITDNLSFFLAMDEASGAALDAAGSNNFADNGGVGAAAGKVSGARSFPSGGAIYLSHATGTAFTTGGASNSFTFDAWVYLGDDSQLHTIAGKWLDGTDGEWRLYYDTTGDRYKVDTYNGATVSTVVANNFGSPTLNTWTHVCLWYDAGASTLNVRVNNGTADTAASAVGGHSTSQDFTLGAAHGGTQPLLGRLDSVMFFKRALNSTDQATLWNGGAGVAYSDISGAADTTPPVVASANVNSAGTTLTIAFTESGSPPVLPASSVTGFTLTASGGAVTLSSTAISSTTFTATTSRTITSVETLTLAYTPGNVTDSAGTPNAMVLFSGTAVTNNSTVPGPLLPGTVAFDSAGPAGGSAFIKMTATDATQGTPTYTYQWKRNTDGGSYSNLTNGSGVTGATTKTLVDGSAVAGHLYGYELVYTDSAGTPVVTTSAAVTASVYTGGSLSSGGVRLVSFSGGFS